MSCVRGRLSKGKNARNVAPYQPDKQSSPQPRRKTARAARRRTRWSWRSRSGSSCERPWRRWPPWRGAASRSGSGAAGCSCTWGETRSPRSARRPSAAPRPCPCPWPCPPWRSPPSWSRSGTWVWWAPRGHSASSGGCQRLHHRGERWQKNHFNAIQRYIFQAKSLQVFLPICILLFYFL